MQAGLGFVLGAAADVEECGHGNEPFIEFIRAKKRPAYS
jgi:hypothetical protein